MITRVASSRKSASHLGDEIGVARENVARGPSELDDYAFILGVATVAATGVVVHGVTDDPALATRKAQELGGEVRLVRLGRDYDSADLVSVDTDAYELLS